MPSLPISRTSTYTSLPSLAISCPSLQVKEAHKGGVTSVAACGESSFASVGHDGFVLVHGA